MKSNNSILSIFAITEIYLLANLPYMFRRVWNISNIYISSVLFLICLVFWLFSNSVHNRRLPSKFNIPFAITIIAWGIYAVIHNDSSYLTRIILLILIYLFLLVLYRKASLVKFWELNNYFILLQTALSLIGFVLVAVGVLHPLLTVAVSDEVFNKNIYFFGFCFSKTYIGNLIRPSGFFDEPGALAGWAVYSLMLNYAFIKEKYVSKYLPIFTVVTLSVAYFIQMAFFYLFAYYNKISKIVLVGILVMVSIFFINTTRDTSFDLYTKTIARFEYSQESIIEGNNREIHMENSKKLFMQSPIVGVGGRTLGQFEEVTSDNPYEILAKDGIIGFIISYLPLIMVLLCNRRKEVLVCVFVIALGYLQRPLHINFIHDMYIWSLLLFALDDSQKRKRISSISNISIV